MYWCPKCHTEVEDKDVEVGPSGIQVDDGSWAEGTRMMPYHLGLADDPEPGDDPREVHEVEPS